MATHSTMAEGFELDSLCPTPDWHVKCWGRTRCLIDSIHYSRHELELEAGGFCSLHWHLDRANVFDVLEGEVRIVWVYGWDIKHQILQPSDRPFEIPIRIPHQFQVLGSGRMIEEYIPGSKGLIVRNDDIARLTTGGSTRHQSFWDVGESVWLAAGKKWSGEIKEISGD